MLATVDAREVVAVFLKRGQSKRSDDACIFMQPPSILVFQRMLEDRRGDSNARSRDGNPEIHAIGSGWTTVNRIKGQLGRSTAADTGFCRKTRRNPTGDGAQIGVVLPARPLNDAVKDHRAEKDRKSGQDALSDIGVLQGFKDIFTQSLGANQRRHDNHCQ